MCVSFYLNVIIALIVLMNRSKNNFALLQVFEDQKLALAPTYWCLQQPRVTFSAI